MTLPAVPLYKRLPEIYRIRDEEIRDAESLKIGPLEAYLKIVEEAFSAIHADIGSLYDDLFIETAADWVIPYIGDLLGTSHLFGDSWTLRADVADTIALRRRKGTLGAIELLTFNLTKWGVRCVELRENLGWTQHLNHQRPDDGGKPPYGEPDVTLHTPIRGGTVTVRDPAVLSLIGTAFDPFGHVVDVRPQTDAAIRYNLPNLGIFLWRLEPYRISLSPPLTRFKRKVTDPRGGAPWVAGFDVFPLDRPVKLFNVRHIDAERRLDPNDRISLTQPDEASGPILAARLTDGAWGSNSGAYVWVDVYQPIKVGDFPLQLHVPAGQIDPATKWKFRGANLCAWEDGLTRPLAINEIAIDPVIGRILIGLNTDDEATAFRDNLLLTFTYGAVGPVGAHPISRDVPALVVGKDVDRQPVRYDPLVNALEQALGGLDAASKPLDIEIQDSMVYDLDLANVAGAANDNGEYSLQLNKSLVIRAATGARPVLRLANPLRFRPVDRQKSDLTVRLEGLFVTRGPLLDADPAVPREAGPLIARAAIDSLEIVGCSLDPGRYSKRNGDLTPVLTSVVLADGYGYTAPDKKDPTPAILLERTISGPLYIDPRYTLSIKESIIDGGLGVHDAGTTFAVAAAGDPVSGWGPPTTVDGVTFFGPVRVSEMEGRGSIWVHPLNVHNNQTGCIKYSYFSATGNRLPQNHACVDGSDAALRFTSEWFGDPGYGQLDATSDFRIRERGPGDDEMGAFGFLGEAHKWRNLQIRYREFMPVGVRPLLIPLT